MAGPLHRVVSLVAVLCLAPLASRCAVEDGLAYDFEGTSTATTAGGNRVTTVIVRGHAWLFNDKLRVDLIGQGSTLNAMRGYYLVALDRGRRLLWIHPEDKTFYEVLSDVGDAGILLPPSLESDVAAVKNVHISVKKRGSGPKLAGHKTVHYRFLQTMDIEQSTPPAVMHNRFTVDYYFPDDLPNFTNPLLFRAVFSRPGKVPKDYLRLVRSELTKLPKLAPVRSIYHDRNIGAPGATTTMETTTFAVSHLRSSDISSGMFEVPGDFTKIDRPLSNSVRDEIDDGEPLADF